MNLTKRSLLGQAAAILAIAALVVADGWYEMKPAQAFPEGTPVPISQTPLAISTPAHPQVLILLGNSQSVDGDLSGAINTGSGALATGDSSLAASSSPTSYTVPAGFTPPLNAGTGGVAPYTVNTGGTLYDNSASRLNVAKAGINAVLTSYLQNTDFGLEVYNPGASTFSTYTTWVYYMSPNGGFTFTNNATDLGTGNATETVPNPCYNYLSLGTSVNVKANCLAIAANPTLNYGSALNTSLYMRVLASSDDAAINDVLYDGSTNDLFVDYNTNNGNPSPASPYTGNFSCGTGLAAYENGCILESYTTDVPYNGVTATSPTNAGYVPFSTQVMYALRGFGYYASASQNSGTVLVSLAQGNAGASPTVASVATAMGHFTPYLAPETNNGSSQEIKALAVQSPLAGLLTTAKSTLAAAVSSNTCNQSQYVILITDGLPTEDLSGKSWPPLGSTAATGYGLVQTFNAAGAYTGNDQALIDTISTITALKTAGVKTYVVGIGAGVDPSANPIAAASLTAMAIAGGTGSYIAATSPTALTNGLSSILSAIQAGTAASTSVAVSSTSLSTTQYQFQATFNPNTQGAGYSDWTGDVTASTINPTTYLPNTPPAWDAQALLDTQASGTGYNTLRAIATWNPSPPPVAGMVTPKGVPFQWASLDAAQQALLQPSDSLGSNRVLYLRGDTALEQRNGGVFRNRTHILGDIVDSQPLFVQTGSGTSPTNMLYVGANDGILHAFNANTGAEVFGFVPNGVMANLNLLSAPLYNQGHHFYVDGSPNSAVVKFADNSTHTILVGGENGGGMSIYALDVTTPLAMNTDANVAAKVLWEFSDATNLGYTYSQPQVVTIDPTTVDGAGATPGAAVVFGNGYDSSANSDTLYFLNPQTGSQIAKINLCTAVVNTTNPCLSGFANGLSTVSYGQKDGLLNQPISTVYVGDLQGNLWAVDVSDPVVTNWKVRLLFQTQRMGSPTAPTSFQPITTAPVVTLNPAYPSLPGLFVMVGTGQLLTANDLSNSTPQSIYGLYDRPYAAGASSSAAILVTPGNSGAAKNTLVSQTLSLLSASAAAAQGLNGPLLLVTNNTVNLNSTGGWYVNLLTGSQEVITQPILYNGGFVTALNTPPGSTCGGTFSSFFLDLNFATGGSFSTPQIDVNGSGTVNGADTVTVTNSNGTTSTTNPAGTQISGTSSASGTPLTAIKGGLAVYTTTLGGGAPKPIVGTNGAPARASWWQIQ
jgi:type IV pilus assembly protein PilY1